MLYNKSCRYLKNIKYSSWAIPFGIASLHANFVRSDLGSWLKTMNVSFCLRLKKNQCLETKNLIWQRLEQLELLLGTALYFQGVRVRKTQPVAGFDIACKWKREYRGVKVKDAWFILTDLGSLQSAIAAYKQRMGIEEIFRDCKSGGYDIEGTGLRGDRLITRILLMAIAYSLAIFQGTQNQKRQVQKYVSRRKEPSKKYRRRSIFGMGQDGEQWINYLAQHSASVQQLMKLTRNKRRFYQQGIRAATRSGSISQTSLSPPQLINSINSLTTASGFPKCLRCIANPCSGVSQ